MLSPLSNPTYRKLFLAQVIALLGTGLATVALGLLAYELAGADAGLVLGTALFLKMIAYVFVAPIVGGYADRLPRRALMIAMDLVRVVIALILPFVDQIWQVYVLIVLLQSASAAFTPTFQATIPDILPDEQDYTKALSLSRLAYDLESLISPMLAAVLLSVIDFHWLFAGTSFGFLVSAALVFTTSLPVVARRVGAMGVWARTTWGTRIYLATPRLRGLLALTLVAAAASAMVIVNTVVYVRGALGRSEMDVAIALGAFGLGSMLAALLLPRLLTRLSDRPVMMSGAGLMIVMMVFIGLVTMLTGGHWGALLVGWLLIGMGYSTVLTPTGRLLRRSAGAEDRPMLFAAQFALSHLCWLITYPVAGWVGARLGLDWAILTLAGLGALGMIAALRLWPARDPDALPHSHADLAPDDPHLQGADAKDGVATHTHSFQIDALHRRWPDV